MAMAQDLKSLVVDYKQTFAGPHGERVLSDLSDHCYENVLTFVDQNPNGSAFNEGKRYAILHIRRMLSMNPEQLPMKGMLNG